MIEMSATFESYWTEDSITGFWGIDERAGATVKYPPANAAGGMFP
jgi:hypothetical protein